MKMSSIKAHGRKFESWTNLNKSEQIATKCVEKEFV